MKTNILESQKSKDELIEQKETIQKIISSYNKQSNKLASDFRKSQFALLNIYSYSKEDELTINRLKENLNIIQSNNFKTKKMILPLLLGIYIINAEHFKSLSKIILEFILEESKNSIELSHLLILNILSCKHSYKKYADMLLLKELLNSIINKYIDNQSKTIQSSGENNKENNNSIVRLERQSSFYTSIFNAYDSIDSFSSKNLSGLFDISKFLSGLGKIRWNKLLLIQKKNEEIKNNKNNKLWLSCISEINFINDLVTISEILKNISVSYRKEEFINFLIFINKNNLPGCIYHPLNYQQNDYSLDKCLLEINTKYSYFINTNERVPMLLIFEYSSNRNQISNIEKEQTINENINIKESYDVKLNVINNNEKIDEENNDSDTAEINNNLIDKESNIILEKVDIQEKIPPILKEIEDNYNNNISIKADNKEFMNLDVNNLRKNQRTNLNEMNNSLNSGSLRRENSFYKKDLNSVNNSLISNIFSCCCTDPCNISFTNSKKDLEEINSGIFGKYSFKSLQDTIISQSKFKINEKIFKKDIESSIIKGADELRCDYFISQIIVFINSLFAEIDPSLNIYLKEMSIITNGNGGFIETIINSISISKINKIKFHKENEVNINFDTNDKINEIPAFNLKKYFLFKFGHNSSTYNKAIENFVKSLGGYSLICYLFGVKDRNNGNILVDEFGHLIHIDFGFLLNKSPGNIEFEQAPFKLTNDFIELMNGINSQYFLEFSEIFLRGFIVIRKNYEIILGLVLMYCDLFSDIQAFQHKSFIIDTLKNKLFIEIHDETELVKKVNDLIFTSINNWRTNAYDKYQNFMVGIK